MRCKKFFKALENNLDGAAFMLGNLYCHGKKDRIEAIKEKITATQIERLWKHIESFPSARMKVMEEANQRSLNTLKHHMLRDLHFSQHISQDSLLNLGSQSNWVSRMLDRAD